jgi:hypothetical protein
MMSNGAGAGVLRDTLYNKEPDSRGIEICSIYAGGKAFPEGWSACFLDCATITKLVLVAPPDLRDVFLKGFCECWLTGIVMSCHSGSDARVMRSERSCESFVYSKGSGVWIVVSRKDTTRHGRVGKVAKTHLACANEADEYDDHTFGTVLVVLDGIEVTVHIVFVQARLG